MTGPEKKPAKRKAGGNKRSVESFSGVAGLTASESEARDSVRQRDSLNSVLLSYSDDHNHVQPGLAARWRSHRPTTKLRAAERVWA